MIPKFLIDGNNNKVMRLFDEHHLYNMDVRVWNGALNACSRGVVRLGYDPKTLELVLAVGEKISPTLRKFASQCGDAELSVAILYLCGVAIERETLDKIRQYL